VALALKDWATVAWRGLGTTDHDQTQHRA